MEIVLVYVEAFPERGTILQQDGVEIELPPEKEEELTLVSEG
jgi:hypothetical protein